MYHRQYYCHHQEVIISLLELMHNLPGQLPVALYKEQVMLLV
ncbi:hypothetical protein [Nostoc sp.]